MFDIHLDISHGSVFRSGVKPYLISFWIFYPNKSLRLFLACEGNRLFLGLRTMLRRGQRDTSRAGSASRALIRFDGLEQSQQHWIDPVAWERSAALL